MTPDYSKLPENAGLTLCKSRNPNEWIAEDLTGTGLPFAILVCGPLGWFVFPPGDTPGVSDKPIAGPYINSADALNAAIAHYRGLPLPPVHPTKTAPPKKSFFE